MSRINHLLRLFVSFLAALGVAAYGCAALVTVADVVGRLIGFPVQGVVDLVQLFIVAGAWLVMPYAFLTGAHVGVDFLLKMIPSAIRGALRVFSAGAALVLTGLMLWYGFETFVVRASYGDSSQQLGIPMEWYWYPMLLGLAVSLLAILLQTLAPAHQEAGHE